MLKKLESILEDKRIAYNSAYVNLFKTFHVNHDDLYGDLDKIWCDCIIEETPKSQKSKVVDTANITASMASGTAVSMTSLFFSLTLAGILAPIGPGYLIFQIVKVQIKVKRLWKNYKENCRKFAEEYVEKL